MLIPGPVPAWSLDELPSLEEIDAIEEQDRKRRKMGTLELPELDLLQPMGDIWLSMLRYKVGASEVKRCMQYLFQNAKSDLHLWELGEFLDECVKVTDTEQAIVAHLRERDSLPLRYYARSLVKAAAQACNRMAQTSPLIMACTDEVMVEHFVQPNANMARFLDLCVLLNPFELARSLYVLLCANSGDSFEALFDNGQPTPRAYELLAPFIDSHPAVAKEILDNWEMRQKHSVNVRAVVRQCQQVHMQNVSMSVTPSTVPEWVQRKYASAIRFEARRMVADTSAFRTQLIVIMEHITKNLPPLLIVFKTAMAAFVPSTLFVEPVDASSGLLSLFSFYSNLLQFNPHVPRFLKSNVDLPFSLRNSLVSIDAACRHQYASYV
jgi:hypothetical protein